jgi:hypothetical protein
MGFVNYQPLEVFQPLEVHQTCIPNVRSADVQYPELVQILKMLQVGIRDVRGIEDHLIDAKEKIVPQERPQPS